MKQEYMVEVYFIITYRCSTFVSRHDEEALWQLQNDRRITRYLNPPVIRLTIKALGKTNQHMTKKRGTTFSDRLAFPSGGDTDKSY